jgi:hypothetical protein
MNGHALYLIFIRITIVPILLIVVGECGLLEALYNLAVVKWLWNDHPSWS